MKIKDVKKQDRVVELFCDLAEIPSPSFKEEAVAKAIVEIFSIYGISAKIDGYGNVIAKIPPSSDCKDVKPILLSAHMDVVGGSEDVNLSLSSCGRFIETDKTRTLGADNKAGVAAIMDAVIQIADLYANNSHGPIEVIFTKDEEKSMTGIKELNTSKLNSLYAIVCDGEKLGEVDIAGAGYKTIYVKVYGGKGGHSGINIDDKTRVNAVKVMSELDCLIPQGVYKKGENGVITSINAAANIGGTAGYFLGEKFKELVGQKNVDKELSSDEVMKTVARNSMTNIISQEAYAAYSLRSSEPGNEKELIEKIKKHADDLVKKYDRRIKIDVVVEKHLQPFVESEDKTLFEVIEKAAENIDVNPVANHFHAGAETHILANEKVNSQNDKFLPLLVGIANIYNMHSCEEHLDWKSLIKGRDWIKSIILEFAKK